ncbi:MAG: hypothetical protein CML16_01350 [Pusillimonas sp.]|nr:hypothetical protein [Pusillimonas sp.]
MIRFFTLKSLNWINYINFLEMIRINIKSLGILLFVSIFIFSACSKDDEKEEEEIAKSNVYISTNFTNMESAGIPGGIARFTIKISNAENFDYLEFHKTTDGIEDQSAYKKLTKFDVNYNGNNEFEEIIEYVLKNEDVDKQHEILIGVFDSDGSVQNFNYSFLVTPKFPELNCYSTLTEGIPYEPNHDQTPVDVYFKVPAGFGDLTAVKTIDGIIDENFSVIINENTATPVDDFYFRFSFTHNFIEVEYEKEVKYKFHLIDQLGREKECEVILNTLAPRPIEAGATFIHNNYDIEQGYILYSISERTLYRLIDVENDPSLESKIDIVFNNGISFSSPSVSSYTENWSTRNVTTFKKTDYTFFDLPQYNAYEIYSFYDESVDTPSFYAGNDYYSQAIAFKTEGVNGNDVIQGMFYVSMADPFESADAGFYIGRKPLN